MKGVTVTLRDGNKAAGVTLTTIVASEGLNIPPAILMLGQGLNPLFSRFGLQVTLQELVDLPGIGLEVEASQWGASYRPFVEAGKIQCAVWIFLFSNDIAQWDTIDSLDGREVIDKRRFPFRPFSFVFELSRVGCFANSIRLVLLDFTDVRTFIRFI